jgi:predicted nucleic acid-binding protein
VTGLDTNVLVRYLVRDEPTQAARATRELERDERFLIGSVVLCELVWVLEAGYGFLAGGDRRHPREDPRHRPVRDRGQRTLRWGRSTISEAHRRISRTASWAGGTEQPEPPRP